MPNEAVALSFDILMAGLEISRQAVKSKEKDLHQAKSELYEKIRGFNTKRLEVFEAQLRINKILWCTYCNQIFPEDQFELVLVVERKSRSCGYEGGDYNFKTTEKLHRACTSCKIKLYEKNGWHGPYDHGAHDQASYFAHQIELRDGEYYQGSKKVEEKLREMPTDLFVRLSQEWNIPPELGLDRDGKLAVKGVSNEVIVP